jgi:hypothetical protein
VREGRGDAFGRDGVRRFRRRYGRGNGDVVEPTRWLPSLRALSGRGGLLERVAGWTPSAAGGAELVDAALGEAPAGDAAFGAAAVTGAAGGSDAERAPTV